MEGDVVVHDPLGIQGVVYRPVLYLKADLRLHLVLPLGVAVFHGAAHHTFDDTVLAELIHALDQGLDGGAVADDGGLVGAVDDLVELVGDNNGGQALLLKRNEQVQQHLGILVVEGGRRLVQDEQLYLLGEGLGDFHQLLLAGTDVLDQGLGRLIESHLLHVALGLIIGLVPVDDPHFVADLVAQEHVLADGEQRNQGQLLVNDYNAQRFAVLLGFKLAQLAFVIDFTGVASCGVGAGQHVHQGGLSRAVFTDEGMDLAGFHLEVHVIQCLDAGEFLGDVFHLQNVL